jgi:ribonucleoside-diphosphate reductase alpha chain
MAAKENIAAKALEAAADGAIGPAGGPSESASRGPMAGLTQCPKCGTAGMVHQEGCDLCLSCGYSKCG